MARNTLTLVLAIAAITLGILICPLALCLLSPDSSVNATNWPLVVKSSLPFVAALAVLAITKESRLALVCALAPMLVSGVYHSIAAPGPLAPVLLEPLAWFNLLLVFPASFSIGLWSLNKRDCTGEPSRTSLERTREK